MDTLKQTVSVLFFFSIVASILCFFNNFDLSSMIFLISQINEMVNRRNMILLCHFILLFIVKDSGLLSPQRNHELSVYKENRAAPFEKESEFEVKEVQLERKEEIRESLIHRSLDIVVIEKTEEVIETDRTWEFEEESMEVTESSGEEEWDDMSEEEVDHKGMVVWEVMEREETEEEPEKERAGVVTESNGEEEEVEEEEEEEEEESVDELNKKIEEFIEKIRWQMRHPVSD